MLSCEGQRKPILKSCGLWLPVGVTGSGLAAGAGGSRAAAVHVGSAGFPEWRESCQGCCV